MKMLGFVAALSFLIGLLASQAKGATRWSCFATGYAGGYRWHGTLGTSRATSCPFAQRVMRSATNYIVRHGGAGNGNFYVRVYSPVTLKWYWMNCEADGDIHAAQGIRVDCRGGIGARVVWTAYA
jgi:hypothetical protein